MSEKPKTVPEATPTHQTANVASSEAYETANAGSDTEPEAGPTFGPPMVAGEVGTLGPYRVLRELGRGGMGAVYLGFDERLKRRVALKVMLPKYASMDSSKNRFLREARAAAGIAHDHIVTIYEAGEHDGTPYLTMQLLQGYPLDSYLKKQAPDLAETLRIGRELALGLSAAHGVGLIHRDIKPGNIWLEAPNGRVKILDFGLAKPTDEQRHDHELTASGVVLGTPSYMPPEQARGDKTDHRADLFSLGVVLYRLAAGRLPFPGTTMMAIFASVMTDEPIPVREWNPAVPEPLAWLIHELLAKKPKDRPASAAEVAERLKQIQLGAAAAISTPMQVIPLDSYSTLSRLPRGADAFADLDATESEAIVTRTNPPVAKKGPTSKWPLLALGLLLVACFALVPQLISIMTPKGTLVIESGDPDVEITVKKDGAILVDKSKGREFTLKVADNYLIEMVEKDGLKLSTDKFEITKGGKATVKVRVEKPKEKPPKPKEASATGAGNVSVADRKAAEWVLSVGGEVRVDGFLTDIKSLADLPKDGYKLTFFSLADNALATDRSLGIFRDCTNLKGLKLDNTSISEAGLAHFKDHPNFEFLFLNGLPNLGGGLVHIKDFQSLGGLYLVGTPVTDESLVHLEGLNALRALVLFKTKVTEAGLKRLAAKVPQCTIEWDGGRILATVTDRLAADWLQSRGGHIGISVPEGHREIRADAGEKVPDVPLELTSFKLTGDQFTADADLAKFRTLSKLDTVVLSQTAVGDAGLEHLATLPVLEKLYLVGTKVTDAGLKTLGRCKQLQVLHLKNTAVTEAGVKAFAARFPNCEIEWRGGTIRPNAGSKSGLAFDGKSTAVTIPTLRFDGMLPVTIEAWITPETVTGQSRHLFLFGTPGGGMGLSEKGNLGIGFFDGSNWHNDYGRSALVPGKRVHVAAVATTKKFELFLDGQSNGNKTVKIGTLAIPNPPALIGKHAKDAPEGFFHGTVHAMRVSKSARYTAQFPPAATFEPDADTLAIYRFDEGAGTKLTDHSGNGHDGVIESGTWAK